MLDKLAKKGLSLSIIAGSLLVPLTALGAIWLTDPDRGAPDSSTPAAAAFAETFETAQTTPTTVDIATDLQAACGQEGMQLVSMEESKTITDVQQAALDALREVCEQQGIPLPAASGADLPAQTVVVPVTTSTGPVLGSSPASFHDDEYDDEDWDDDELEDRDDDEREDEREDDHEHEDEHEDEDD